ncbi:MAG: methyltransferase domain-containing protein [Archaeoglobaceae archaeon]|nr:methyltransferase domain-containing protein [Archaeoglobaceae archaeon]MDW8118073.1 methyltransferase domain-containing protein [Archaeoglobaceae archaeon]
MWDEIAKRYHSWSLNNRWYYYKIGLEIKRAIGEPKFILDVGSGSGIFAEELKNLFPDSKIFCLDSSNEMCKLSRGIRGEASFLPFKDKIFDLVTFCYSLHELEIQSALEEAKRVLLENGWIYIVDLNKYAPEVIKRTSKLILGNIMGLKYANHLEKTWNAFESCEEIVDRLTKMRFDVEWRKSLNEIRILAKKI